MSAHLNLILSIQTQKRIKIFKKNCKKDMSFDMSDLYLPSLMMAFFVAFEIYPQKIANQPIEFYLQYHIE